MQSGREYGMVKMEQYAEVLSERGLFTSVITNITFKTSREKIPLGIDSESRVTSNESLR